MKRITTLLVLLTLFSIALPAKGRNTKFRMLVSEYRGQEGFEVVNLGGPLLSLIRGAVKMGAEDAEEKAAIDLLRGIRHLTVVDYEDCAPGVKDEFNRRLRKLLSGEEVLIEAHDDGESVKIYGCLSEDGSILKDIIIHAETDGALISILGSIRMDQVDSLVRMANQ